LKNLLRLQTPKEAAALMSGGFLRKSNIL